MDVPFSRSYWVVAGTLLAGCYPGSRDHRKNSTKLSSLLAGGIRTVIDLTKPHEQDWSGLPTPSYGQDLESLAGSMGFLVTVVRMPIRDAWVPSRPEMCRILDRIDQSIEQGSPVYVHCWGGLGRTGSVVGCYLLRHGLAFSENVLDRIRELRKNTPDHNLQSPETNTQVEFVLSWVEGE